MTDHPKSMITYGELTPGVWFVPQAEDDSDHQHAMFMLLSTVPVSYDDGLGNRYVRVKLTWLCTRLSRTRGHEIVTEELQPKHKVDAYWTVVRPSQECTVQRVAQ